MTLPLASGYISDLARTEAEVQQALEDIASVEREMLGGQAEEAVTIAAGVATIVGTSAIIDTEAAAATDNLDNIAQPAGQQDGKVAIIRSTDAARVITVRHNQGGTGEILLADDRDAVLDDPAKRLILQRVGTTWEEIGRNFVDGMLREVKNVTTTYPVVVQDNGKMITADATTGAFDVDLPAAAVAGNGFKLTIKKTDATVNAVTIDPDGAETIDGVASVSLSAQNSLRTIVSNGTEWKTAVQDGGASTVSFFNHQYINITTQQTTTCTANTLTKIGVDEGYTKTSGTSTLIVRYSLAWGLINEAAANLINTEIHIIGGGGGTHSTGGTELVANQSRQTSGVIAFTGISAGGIAIRILFVCDETLISSDEVALNPNSGQLTGDGNSTSSVIEVMEIEL